jgi:ABC-type uncharacterized transport system involved in gliding motility auxiliary subunit
VLGTDIFERPSSNDPTAKPKFKGEQIFTSTIINVTSGIKRKINFVAGHKEASLSGYSNRDIAALNELLVRENFEVGEVNLVNEDIDPDTSLLAIISPQRDYLDSEIAKIRSYVKGRNTHLLIALDPMSDTSNLEEFMLQEFGVMANNDIVVDPRGLQRQYWTVSPEYTSHKALAPLRQSNLISIMFHCRSLNVEGREGYTATEVLNTIEGAWAKRGIESAAQLDVAFEEGKDARGPLKLAVAVEDYKNASGSKILIFGDSDFISNSYISFGGNKDLCINLINWMLGQEQLISIRPKIVEIPQIVLDKDAAGHIFTVAVILSPILIVVLGFGVFLYRRRVA